jgi:hypothetical protein
MGLIKVNGATINQDSYVYPLPEIVFQTTRNLEDVKHLGSGVAKNDNGYLYFYADADWKSNPTVYIGESKNSIQSRHNATHKKSSWLKGITYPFVGIVNSPMQLWDTDTRRAIESQTIYEASKRGFIIVNSENATWANGADTHDKVNQHYVNDVAALIIEYLMHHTGWNGQYVDKIEQQVSESQLLAGKPSEDQHSSPKHGGSGKEFTIKPPVKSNTNPTVKDLVESGILPVGIIKAIAPRYPGSATLTAEGKIVVAGKAYTSPSTAGGEHKRLTNPSVSDPNGWTFWGVEDSSGNTTTLSAYRAQYLMMADRSAE